MNNNIEIIVANWKMQLPYTQGIEFFTTHGNELATLAHTYGRQLVLCPSFELLFPLLKLSSSFTYPLTIGAQDCSSHTQGAYTGQVSARSLAQLGCTFCIVGHNERRKEFAEDTELIGKKLIQLLENNITPIICIGESEQAHQTGTTQEELKKQIDPLLKIIGNYNTLVYYAYEPTWTIGTGLIPDSTYVKTTISWLAHHLSTTHQLFKLLYGGGVHATTLPELASIKSIDGVLIGSASVDFQKFKNIVSWNT